MKRTFEGLKVLTYFTQIAISMIVPIGLCILGAVKLREWFGLGYWVVILGAIIGVVAGFQGVLKLGIQFSKQNQRGRENLEQDEDGERGQDDDHKRI